MQDLKDIDLFMMDMDGTIYWENQLIPGALDFFDLLRRQCKKYVFMTNNSSKDKVAYVDKLMRLGISATEENIASSIDSTILYLKNNHSSAKLYVVGTELFKRELCEAGFIVVPPDYREIDVDYVVMGYDTELSYEKIEGACYYVSRGYEFVATNCDMKCPIRDNMFLPDCGAIANMIEVATGRLPKFLGKPNRMIIDYVSKKNNISIDRIACVGDRLYTDIAVGVNAGATTICVLTGEAKREDIETSQWHPDYCFPSIAELYKNLL